MPMRLVIDTDPGVDDAMALILALRWPDASVEAITTVSGNVPVTQATRNPAPVSRRNVLQGGTAEPSISTRAEPLTPDLVTHHPQPFSPE